VSQWGRKEYQDWPSGKPVWTLAALAGAVLLFALALATQYARSWSFVSRARYDAQIYTNDAGSVGKALSREVSHGRHGHPDAVLSI
jgi:hypothetical protein